MYMHSLTLVLLAFLAMDQFTLLGCKSSCHFSSYFQDGLADKLTQHVLVELLSKQYILVKPFYVSI